MLQQWSKKSLEYVQQSRKVFVVDGIIRFISRTYATGLCHFIRAAGDPSPTGGATLRNSKTIIFVVCARRQPTHRTSTNFCSFPITRATSDLIPNCSQSKFITIRTIFIFLTRKLFTCMPSESSHVRPACSSSFVGTFTDSCTYREERITN